MAKNQSEEVNLLDVLAGLFASLKRNIILTILLPLSGIAIALVITLYAPNRYESSLLLETSLLTENECRFLFDELEKAGFIPGLAAENSQALSHFVTKVFVNESPINASKREPEITLNEKVVYAEVSVTVTDKAIYSFVEKAILDYIHQSPAAARHRKERERFYTDMISRITSEIEAMEQVKREVSPRSQATFLNPSDLYAQTVTLYKEKALYEIKRDEIQSVHLLKGLNVLSKDSNRNIARNAVIGFVLGLFVLAIVLFIQFFLQYFRAYESRVN